MEAGWDDMQQRLGWPVMVLAHNEEEKIVACLDSLFAAEPGQPLEIYVRANGCTDRTEELVRAYAERRPEVHLVSLRLGDKCHAWNVFIHDTVAARCPGRDSYVFMDGDARVGPGSLSALAASLRANPHAHAASALPGAGRSMAKDRAEMLQHHGLVANLYAMRGTFVDRLRASGVRLPLHLEGDDGLLGALIKWDLEPRGKRDQLRIQPCEDAAFLFDPVNVLDRREWTKYWRRLVRYGRRQFEFQLLGPRLKEMGLLGLPRDVQELYTRANELKLWRWGGYLLTDSVALWEMRRIGRKRAGRPFIG